MHRLVVLLSVALAVGLGQNLLTNGDFEQELTTGWTRGDSGYGTHEVNRGPGYHPDPDYEVYVYQYDNPGVAQLIQYVDVPGSVLSFSFWAKFEEGGGSSSCWPAGVFSVYYCDASDAVLGETRFYYSAYANWTPSPTLSLSRITNPNWAEYTLDIASELSTNLPGVDPGQVARIGIAVTAYASGG